MNPSLAMRIDKCGVVVGRIIAYGETLQLDFVDTRGIPITVKRES
jgi:hypothetical protein